MTSGIYLGFPKMHFPNSHFEYLTFHHWHLESLPGEFAENLESSVPDNQTLQVFSIDDVIFF
jgi:hypothetical protein